jgi:hypothetical protein
LHSDCSSQWINADEIEAVRRDTRGLQPVRARDELVAAETYGQENRISMNVEDNSVAGRSDMQLGQYLDLVQVHTSLPLASDSAEGYTQESGEELSHSCSATELYRGGGFATKRRLDGKIVYVRCRKCNIFKSNSIIGLFTHAITIHNQKTFRKHQDLVNAWGEVIEEARPLQAQGSGILRSPKSMRNSQSENSSGQNMDSYGGHVADSSTLFAGKKIQKIPARMDI